MSISYSTAGQSVAPTNLDYIVVLGGESQHERSDYARELWDTAENKPMIIVSDCLKSREMLDYLVNKGIDPNYVLVDDKARNTLENLVYSGNIIAQESEESAGSGEKVRAEPGEEIIVGLVTDEIHMPRAMMLAKMVWKNNGFTIEYYAVPREYSAFYKLEEGLKTFVWRDIIDRYRGFNYKIEEGKIPDWESSEDKELLDKINNIRSVYKQVLKAWQGLFGKDR